MERGLTWRGRRVFARWLAGGGLGIFLAFGPAHGWAAEVALSREVTIQGENLVGQLAPPIAEMKRELTAKGCGEFSLAYWTVEDSSTRLHVEVRCLRWMPDVPSDSSGETERVSQGLFGASGR